MLNQFMQHLALVRQPSALDAERFARLYEEHVGAVFNYCMFCLHDPVLAEDLTADTFERAWRHRTRFRPDRAEFTTWLFVIARRLVIDAWRRHARHPTVPLEDSQADDCLPPDQAYELTERLNRLQALTKTLVPQDIELVAMKFGAGLSNRQIAQLCGKSEAAVASAVYRIMQRLRHGWEVSDGR